MKPNTMQLMQHSTQKAAYAMPHETQSMPPIPPMQLYGGWVYSCMGKYEYKCIAIHRCMGAMDA